MIDKATVEALPSALPPPLTRRRASGACDTPERCGVRNSGAPRVAIIGEPLIELSGTLFGAMNHGYGGDSLNFALYLSRIMCRAARVSYASVLGTDELSEGMVVRWQAAGINTQFVLRDPSRIPGLYMIQTDGEGERRFFYWRQDSAARYLLRHPLFAEVAAHLAEMDWVFLTGISLAVLPAEDRLTLIALLNRLALDGIAIAFDTNYRPELWADRNDAREALAALMPALQVVLTSLEDERLLWGVNDPKSTFARLRVAGVHDVVVKMGAQGAMFNDGETLGWVPSFPVPSTVDTTAAGDSFDAAYIAGILSNLPVAKCCSMGNALAAIVVAHQGAIIPLELIPALEDLETLSREAVVTHN